MISFITTCKNRLAHLQQSLPLMLQQSGAEVVVVDYDCPEGTGGWVERNHPQAKLVRVSDEPEFMLARARNLGARAASGDLLCFIDADTLLTGDIGAWAASQAAPGGHYRLPPGSGGELVGFAICWRRDYDAVGGYDEAFRGWGGEDVDFYDRLENHGARCIWLPRGMAQVISHGDDTRQLGGEGPGMLPSRAAALAANRVYRQAKRDAGRLLGRELALAERTALRLRVVRAHLAAIRRGAASFVIELRIPAPRGEPAAGRAERFLSYACRLAPAPAGPLALLRRRVRGWLGRQA